MLEPEPKLKSITSLSFATTSTLATDFLPTCVSSHFSRSRLLWRPPARSLLFCMAILIIGWSRHHKEDDEGGPCMSAEQRAELGC